MEITQKKVTIKELFQNYSDDGEGGVYAYGGKLEVRPPYQREFVYDDKKRNAVINTIMKNFPLNIMYWSDNGDGTYELIDGQQRTISICQYLNNEFSIDNHYYKNLLSGETKDIIDNYELLVFVCKGTEEEKLDWFRTINIAGEPLTDQEMLNATYIGTYISDAKIYFSKRNCVAKKISDNYVKGNPIRQDLLEKALKWIADRDGVKSIEEYMAIHQKDKDANELWVYYQNVINWAKTIFPTIHKGITDSQEWGLLYNKYHTATYNTTDLERELKELILDDEVTKKSGIIPYLLSKKTEEKHLSIRAFTEAQKLKAYEKQGGICPICKANGNQTTHYELQEMQADHIIAWSKGGKTTDDNIQMLCSKCNNTKKAT